MKDMYLLAVKKVEGMKRCMEQYGLYVCVTTRDSLKFNERKENLVSSISELVKFLLDIGQFGLSDIRYCLGSQVILLTSDYYPIFDIEVFPFLMFDKL